jgi:hypothetical protein
MGINFSYCRKYGEIISRLVAESIGCLTSFFLNSGIGLEFAIKLLDRDQCFQVIPRERCAGIHQGSSTFGDHFEVQCQHKVTSVMASVLY